MLIVQTNGWWKEKRAGIAVIQKGATAEVSAEENPAAAPRTPKNTSARQQGFMCSPSQSSAPIPHHPYIPQKKKTRNTLLQHLPRAVRSPFAFEFLTNPKNQFKMKRYQFQRSFFFFSPSMRIYRFIMLIKLTRIAQQPVRSNTTFTEV